MEYPSAPRSSATDDFMSVKSGPVKVPNPYNWLEDAASSQTQAFINSQNSQFESFIQDLDLDMPGQVIQKILLQLNTLPSLAGIPHCTGEHYYFRVAGQRTVFPVTYRVPKSRVTDIKNGHGLLEVSAEFHNEANDGGALVSSGFSKSGKYWAYSSSIKGSAWVKIRIKDTTTNELLREELTDTKFAAKEMSISWFGDQGFFYQYWPDREKKGEPQLRFHRVGNKQEDDLVVFEDEENPDHTFAVEMTQDDQFLLLYVFRGGRNNSLRAARINSESLSAASGANIEFEIKIEDKFEAEWRQVQQKYVEETRSINKYSYVGTSGSSLLCHSTANNGQLVTFSTADSKLDEVIPGAPEKTLKFAKMVRTSTFQED
jgi:prolyl oligopeptidase